MGKQENGKTGEQENGKTGKQENRKTGKQENRKTGKQENGKTDTLAQQKKNDLAFCMGGLQNRIKKMTPLLQKKSRPLILLCVFDTPKHFLR